MTLWEIVLDVFTPGSPRSAALRTRIDAETARIQGLCDLKATVTHPVLDPLDEIVTATHELTARFTW